MAKNERGEEMLQPNQKTVLEKYCVFAPDGLPMVQTISQEESTSMGLAVESMQHGFANSWPNWSKLKKWGASCQKVTVTIEVNG